MGMFRESYQTGTFPKSLNTTFLVVIPKKGELMIEKIFVLSV